MWFDDAPAHAPPVFAHTGVQQGHPMGPIHFALPVQALIGNCNACNLPFVLLNHTSVLTSGTANACGWICAEVCSSERQFWAERSLVCPKVTFFFRTWMQTPILQHSGALAHKCKVRPSGDQHNDAMLHIMTDRFITAVLT